jgi:hypothetical protein
VRDLHFDTKQHVKLRLCVFNLASLDTSRVISVQWLCCGLDNRGIVVRFPAGPKSLLLNRPDWMWGPLRHFTRVKISRGVKLIPHVHLVPRLRMTGAIPPLIRKFSWRGA